MSNDPLQSVRERLIAAIREAQKLHKGLEALELYKAKHGALSPYMRAKAKRLDDSLAALLLEIATLRKRLDWSIN